MTLSVTVLPLVALASLITCKDYISWYDSMMEKIMDAAFKMTKMDVLGFRRQRTVLQFTYETIP